MGNIIEMKHQLGSGGKVLWRRVVGDTSGDEAGYASDGDCQRVRKLVDEGAVTDEYIYVGGWGRLDEERTTVYRCLQGCNCSRRSTLAGAV